MTELASDLDVALAAAAAGASAVRAAYGAALIKHGKSGTDFATDADIDAERAILDVITGARPRDAVDGEELGRSGSIRARRRWLVDPLCGTLNFAAHTPLVALNVALVDASGTLVAVSVDPIADEVFWTDGQRAAVRNGGIDTPLKPSSAGDWAGPDRWS